MAYISIDTNEVWTEEEIREIYDSEESLKEQYETFDDYMEWLLDLGRQRSGGIVEE